MKHTFKILTLALSVTFPMGSALAAAVDTAATAVQQPASEQLGQARMQASEFKAGELSRANGYQSKAPEPQLSRNQRPTGLDTNARTGREYPVDASRVNVGTGHESRLSNERPVALQRPSFSRPSLPVQRPRMR